VARTRREFLALGAAPLLAAAADLKKTPVALIITEYRTNAHADVICTRILEGYEIYGKRHDPRIQAVSMFTDQIPANDMSRAMAAKNRVPVFPTIPQALKLDGSKLAVEGVVLVGEHGNYPENEKGQKLYPRYDLYRQVVEVFRASGRSVPVFCDKHLSTDWKKAKWMYDQSRELKFPFMAGSSLPIAWRKPELELPAGVNLRHAVVAAYGGNEAYGFHALETLQCMAERRKGGETGIAAVRMTQGREVWEWTDAHQWAGPLLDAAVACSATKKQGAVRDNARNPALFELEYKDGFRAAVYMLDGHLSDFNFAGEVAGRAEPAASLFWLQSERFYGHFATLTWYIEELMTTRKEPYPVERTLLTTGALAALMESNWRGHERIETPHLAIRYKAPSKSLYNRGPVPAPERA
jgi:hypothetical protein